MEHDIQGGRTSLISNRTDELTSLLSREGSHVGPKRRGGHKGVTTRIDLTWKNLTYEVKIAKTKDKPKHIKTVLNSVSGHVRSGQMLAVLGPSGAGKTTMLDILANREKGGKISGELLMNGAPIDPKVFRRVSAYVQQEDILHGYLTVRETIRYAAKLRSDSSVSAKEIEEKVQHVMELLGIEHVSERKIGSEFVRGVSGGEKKRTAIAVELVTDPSLMYLDEPTTGLDTFTAMHLLTILKNLTKLGVAVIFSIHQPRSSIFRLFDTLLLLNSFGEEAYYGPAQEAMGFLDSIGVRCLEPDNPADFLLDSVSVVRAAENLSKEDFPSLPPPTQSQDIAAAFRSTKLNGIIEDIDKVVTGYAEDSKLPPGLESPYYRPIWTQVWVVSTRALLNKVRDPIATFVAIIVAMIFAVLVGSIYYQISDAQSGIQDRLGVLFFLTMNTAFSNLGSLAMFLMDRSIYIREHRNGMYRPSAYYIGKILQDVPLGIAINFFFSITAYYMVGLQPAFEKFLWFWIISALVMLNSFGMCMFVSNIAPNYQVANVVAPLILVLFLIPSGFLINLDNIPIVWRWIKYISFFRYGYEALVINEFKGLTFKCDQNNNDNNNNQDTTTTTAAMLVVGDSAGPETTTEAVPGGNNSSGYSRCWHDGSVYVEYTLGFHEEDFSNCVIYTSVSIGVYILLGYCALRFLRHGEGK